LVVGGVGLGGRFRGFGRGAWAVLLVVMGFNICGIYLCGCGGQHPRCGVCGAGVLGSGESWHKGDTKPVGGVGIG